MLYHITTCSEAEVAQDSGEFAPKAFGDEGFIHCSHRQQVTAVANRLFCGRSDLVLLEINPAHVAHDIVEENLEGGEELFPHIYGRLPMAALVRVHPFPCGDDGSFELPPPV